MAKMGKMVSFKYIFFTTFTKIKNFLKVFQKREKWPTELRAARSSKKRTVDNVDLLRWRTLLTFLRWLWWHGGEKWIEGEWKAGKWRQPCRQFSGEG